MADSIPADLRERASSIVRTLDRDNPPALKEIQELADMQRSGKIEEIQAMRNMIKRQEDPEKIKKLQVDLEEKEYEVEKLKAKIDYALKDWELGKHDRFSQKKWKDKNATRKRNLKLYMLNIERKLLELPEGSARKEHLEAQKRAATKKLNIAPFSEV